MHQVSYEDFSKAFNIVCDECSREGEVICTGCKAAEAAQKFHEEYYIQRFQEIAEDLGWECEIINEKHLKSEDSYAKLFQETPFGQPFTFEVGLDQSIPDGPLRSYIEELDKHKEMVEQLAAEVEKIPSWWD